MADGKEVTAEKVFKPDTANGSVDMEFTFDGSKLSGKTIVVFEELYLNVDTNDDGKPDTPSDKPTAEHKDIKDEGQTIYFPEIGTTATDSETGDHISNPDKEVTIKDTVSYKNLIPGKEYTVSGVLMDKATGKPILVDGKKVTAKKTFIADSANGSVDMEFTFDGSALEGKTVVVFEKLLYNGKEVGVHEDIKDKDQTVYFPEIGTKAGHFATGLITDTVSYKNLIPGKEYTVKGVLMDKETGKPVLSDGEEVTAIATFTPKTASGTVKLNFGFREADLYGKTVVVFEKIYLDGELIGSHEDLNDKNQTVEIDKPEVPGTPENPGTPGTPQTGDNNNLMLYIGLTVAALALITLLLAYRRRQMQNQEKL